MRARRGYTLIEMMMVVAVLGVLTSLSYNEFEAQRMRAKRAEAMIGLRQLWNEEMGYFYRSGHFSGTFDDLDFQQSGGKKVSARTYQGINYAYQISQPWGQNSFYCVATAQLDSDPWPDVLEIFEKGR